MMYPLSFQSLSVIYPVTTYVNSNNFRAINTRASQYYQASLPSTVTFRSWNGLPVEAYQYDTLNSFKYYINKDTGQVPQNVFKPVAEKLRSCILAYAQNCSYLNFDIFMKNITDSPLCSCGTVEDAQHYFFFSLSKIPSPT